MKGFRRIFVAGFCTFTTGSLGCGLSQGFAQLILFRVIQATGAALIFLTLFALLYALNMGHEYGFTSGRILGSFGAAVVFGGLFIRQEACSCDPLINLTLFRNATFTIANLTGGLMTGAIERK